MRLLSLYLIDDVNIVSGNGLVPSGNKPLPEPMLTQFYVSLASLGHNELTLIMLNVVKETLKHICNFS